MKSFFTLILFIAAFNFTLSAQTTHTITNSGLTFTPDSVAAIVGDHITFNLDFSTHPLHEVSAGTWAANQSTQLSGGFSATSGNTFTVTMTQAGTRYYVCANHVGSGMKGRLFVTAPNGIQNIASVAASAYPNPANSSLHIISPVAGELHCVLINMIGQTVLDQTESVSERGILSLDISSLDEGNYILSIANANGQVNRTKVQITR